MNHERNCRREFLRKLGTGAIAIALNGAVLRAGGQRGTDKPNIVCILADDMGYGDLACQNPESKIATPNLDSLAEQGVRFTDAHSPSSVGRGTRYGLLTGRYPWRAELKRSTQQCWSPSVIEPGRLTVGKLLKQHGYDAACIGKWHLGMDWPTTDGKGPICVGRTRTADGRTNVDFNKPIANGPTAHGFDYYFGVLATHFSPYCFIENEYTVGIPTLLKKGIPGCPGPMIESWKLEEILPGLMNKAVEYIDDKGGRVHNKAFRQTEGTPFFLYVALTAPRTPIVPAAQFQGKSGAGAYGDFVEQLDYVVGRLAAALERNRFVENTLVIFTSDNGSPGRDGKNMMGGLNSVREYGHNPSGPWRGIKTDIWEGGHRVPFVARWPGRIPAGTTSDETICHVDLLATAAAILGRKLPDESGEDSYDILPAMRGEKVDRLIREATVHCSGNDVLAIRRGKWKLITRLGSGGWSRPSSVESEPDGPTGQLYDLQVDPGETNNLWLEQPKIVEALNSILDKYRRDGRSR
ncbi:MAG: arylsulfatase [Sedimentisphaerales bacterium]|nr:arylsulfatase [Sedimentisphaerales bacterium]